MSKKKSPITTETSPTTYTENSNNFELGDLDWKKAKKSLPFLVKKKIES